jgi:hypothetical protein
LTRSFAVKPSAISAGNNKSACPSRSMISDFMRRHLLACALKKADEHDVVIELDHSSNRHDPARAALARAWTQIEMS